MLLVIIAVVTISFIPVFAQNENVLCTSSYCADVKCDSTITNCDIQNSTNNGISFPSPDTCNCCEFCLSYLKENDACSTGSPDGVPVKDICGPGLICIDGTCKTMTTECYTSQKDYDERKKNGMVGNMENRPNCDGRGFYETYKCIPGEICYCVHKNGSRIFGLSDFTDIPSYKMKCGCSRSYYDAVDIIGAELHPNQHFRCQTNGDYDNLQCIGDDCLCVDTTDGTPYSDTVPVNIKKISKLKCYNSKIHIKGYYKKCEEEYLKKLNETEDYLNSGYRRILSNKFPNCDLDGTYAPLQQNKTHKMCVDPNGSVLISLEKNHVLAPSMNCKCIQAASVATSTDVPKCLENGNYNPKQCRKGFCRCVDDDGNQVCLKEGSCPDVEEGEALDCSTSNI